ncbi:MAG: glycosyltransferase family 2 protein [Bacteroidota bacterium]
MPPLAKYPKISVVTPNFNQGAFIERTLQSVLDQQYPELEYIVIDGGSTDDSREIISKYQEQLHYWVSEPDDGMYHAINKGFLRATGEIMCWINSDDVLWEGSLETVARIFQENPEISWLQGYPSMIDEQDQLILQREPVANRYYFLRGYHQKEFSFIQQESTFWTRSLWEKAGGTLNLEYQLAADFDLWMRFFEHEELYCTRQQLAAFRKREGQKSADMGAYLSEARRAVQQSKKKLRTRERLQLKSAKLLKTNGTNFKVKWV